MFIRPHYVHEQNYEVEINTACHMLPARRKKRNAVNSLAPCSAIEKTSSLPSTSCFHHFVGDYHYVFPLLSSLCSHKYMRIDCWRRMGLIKRRCRRIDGWSIHLDSMQPNLAHIPRVDEGRHRQRVRMRLYRKPIRTLYPYDTQSRRMKLFQLGDDATSSHKLAMLVGKYSSVMLHAIQPQNSAFPGLKSWTMTCCIWKVWCTSVEL